MAAYNVPHPCGTVFRAGRQRLPIRAKRNAPDTVCVSLQDTTLRGGRDTIAVMVNRVVRDTLGKDPSLALGFTVTVAITRDSVRVDNTVKVTISLYMYARAR